MRAVVALLAVLIVHVLRLVLGDSPSTGLSMLLVIPVAVVAAGHGARLGSLAGGGAYLIFAVWDIMGNASVGVTGHLVRGAVLVTVGAATGWTSLQLRRTASRQRYLADAVADMVSAHDPAGNYTYVTGAARSILGYEPHQLIGTQAYDYFHPHDVSKVRAAHERILDGTSSDPVVYRVRRADGRYAWFETVSRAVRQGDQVVEILCSSRDVTRREMARAAEEADASALRQQIEQVLAARSIEPVLQPIAHLQTRDVIGYEALARFPLVSDRPPNIWFEQARELGLAGELECLAVARALERLPHIPPEAWISINISPSTVVSTDFLDTLDGAALDRVVIELTEHSRIDDYTNLNRAVHELRANGARFAVDDAGAGFASLRHILMIRPEIIKLDMGFTRHIHLDVAKRAIATAVKDVAENLGAQVIAEGVEHEPELDQLVRLGITHGQGYLLGAPAWPLPAKAG